MDYKYLTTLCQYEMPGQPHPVDCGEPAVARVWWDDGSEMLVCQEHLDFMVKTEEDPILTEALRQQKEE